MRKFLSLVAVFLFAGTAWMSVDAKWYKGDRKIASRIQANDTIILAAASSEAAVGHYLDGTQIVGEFTQTTPFVVESATDGKFYLKQLSSGKFLGYSSLGLADSDKDGGTIVSLVDGTEKALAFSITDGTQNTSSTKSTLSPEEWVQFAYSFTDSKEEQATHYLATY